MPVVAVGVAPGYCGDMNEASHHARQIVHAAGRIDALRAARERSGPMLIGLDFDGTLAAIVPRPADAALVEGAAPVLAKLSGRDDTIVAIVTGRSIADARTRMGIDGIHYAGNHGLEIEGPGIAWVHSSAKSARSAIDELLAELASVLGSRADVTFEDKLLSASVHFREVADEAEQARIARIVHDTAARLGLTRKRDDGGALTLTEGKMVVEIRPTVDWDKGRAFASLRSSLGLDDSPAVFIGDDMTDEDAFRELRGRDDVAIVVGEERFANSRASAMLPDIAAVVRFLAELAA